MVPSGTDSPLAEVLTSDSYNNIDIKNVQYQRMTRTYTVSEVDENVLIF
jgi:hypothetical protein